MPGQHARGGPHPFERRLSASILAQELFNANDVVCSVVVFEAQLGRKAQPQPPSDLTPQEPRRAAERVDQRAPTPQVVGPLEQAHEHSRPTQIGRHLDTGHDRAGRVRILDFVGEERGNLDAHPDGHAT